MAASSIWYILAYILHSYIHYILVYMVLSTLRYILLGYIVTTHNTLGCCIGDEQGRSQHLLLTLSLTTTLTHLCTLGI